MSLASRKCASCQAPLVFDPKSGGMKCEYCETTRPVPSGAEVPMRPLAQAAAFRGRPVEGVQLARCSNCHAETEVTEVTAATRCAFCAAPVEVATRQALTPAEGVVPFSIPMDEAGAAFERWIRRLWFRPNDLKRRARLREMRGSYVPAWVFHAQADSSWSADAGYYYYEEVTKEEDGRTVTERVQRTRWEHRTGQHAAFYRNLVVSASRGVPAEELSTVEPYDLARALRTFDADYLAGFEAETHGIDAGNGWRIAEERIREKEHDACEAEVPGDTHRDLRVSTVTSREQFQSVLLPLWVAAFEYRSDVYRVIVNGQTGKVAGKAPWSAAKITAFVLVLAAVIAGVVWYLSQQG